MLYINRPSDAFSQSLAFSSFRAVALLVTGLTFWVDTQDGRPTRCNDTAGCVDLLAISAHSRYKLRISVVATTADSLSIIITIGRLVYRSRRVKLWWDDAWAAASMVAAIVLLTGMWIHSEAPGQRFPVHTFKCL